MKYILIFILVCLAYQVIGAQQEYDPVLSKTIYYYSKATYCTEQDIGNWTCKACTHLPGISHVKVFNIAKTGTQSYVAYNEIDNQIIIAFRGTVGIRDKILDFDIILKNYDACPNCRVHSGFKIMWNTQKDLVLQEFKKLKSEYPNAKIIVTGHSLGGALSELCSYELYQMGYPVDYLYNYGAPSIGNKELAQYGHSIYPNLMRVVNLADPVSHEPSQQKYGYYQVPTEIWYDNPDDDLQYKVCKMPGIELDPECSVAQDEYVYDDHLWYLGIYCGCGDRHKPEIE